MRRLAFAIRMLVIAELAANVGCNRSDATFLTPQKGPAGELQSSTPGATSGAVTAPVTGVSGSTGNSGRGGSGPVVSSSGGSHGSSAGASSGLDGPSSPALDAPPGLDVRPAAVTNSHFPGHLELNAPGWIATDAFPNLSFLDATSLTEAPGTGHLFVTEQLGFIYALPKSADTREKTLVLDLSSHTQAYSDSGLLGIAFHPEFGRRESVNKGYMYVHYEFSPNPVIGQGAPVNPRTPAYSRLSRFTVDLDTLVADPSSELVLIDQADEHLWHQGGALFFNPRDGFLYVSVGDEGDYRCAFDNCQRINRDLFSGVLRIDVDQRGGAISHPIQQQPATGRTANYYIPNDNPFVGQPGVLEEFYALGLRCPYKMTYDAVDNISWLGDVGQFEREELDVLQKGANYQWAALEGSLPGPASIPLEPLGVWTPPVLELQREEAVAVVGGYVYRGSKFPELWGKYIFGDFGRGNIWALSYEYDGQHVRVVDRQLLLHREFRVTSFGVDSSGELYFLLFGPQKVQRLERTGGSSNVPDRLSETAVFPSLRVLDSPQTLIPYEVQNPLWSDGAQKQRWMLLPREESIAFSENGPWAFPPGTFFVKHFSMNLDERHPTQQSPLETRFLVRADDGSYYGMSYRWNAEGTDAELVRDRRTETLTVTQQDGTTREQRYFFPGPSDCLVCHNPAAGYVLGLRTAQLNGEFTYAATGRTSNQLLTWSRLGLFGESAPLIQADSLHTYPQLAALDDESRSLEDRVRSYWDSNCSMCHGVLNDIRATWDARYAVPLAQQRVLGVPAGSLQDPTSPFLIAPGAAEHSVMYLRGATTDPNLRMPPLGRNRIDSQYLELLQRWIQSLSATP